MVKWAFTLDIQDAWIATIHEVFSTLDLSCVIVERLTNIRHEIINKFGSGSDQIVELDTILSNFKIYISIDFDSEESFDKLFNALYDWGDKNNICWIKTFA